MSLKDFFKKLFGKKEEPVRVIRHKDPTEFLKSVNVTMVDQDIKPAESGKILLFEDSQVWAEKLKSALENSGYKVFLYNSFKEPVEKVKETKPDLVLVDVQSLPTIPYDITRQIKSKISFKELPVIILSSISDDKSKMEAMKAGARTILFKDQPFDVLITAIQAFMSNTALKSDISQIINVNKQK